MSGAVNVVTVLGTRPEIVKFSTLLPELDARFGHALVHTGQHYDPALDAAFFAELGLRSPDVNLAIGSGRPGAQTGRMLEAVEAELVRLRPEVVLVLGDTNTALAGALAAAKQGIAVGHVEAGCRSFVRSMPEEINRTLIADVADLHFAPDADAVRHLKREGIAREAIVRVGNPGLDAARRIQRLAGRERLEAFGVAEASYVLATFHRAENTDDRERCAACLESLARVAERVPVLVPVHPRTGAAVGRHGLAWPAGVRCLPPLGPLDFSALLQACACVVTDSGGVQEEAAVVNRPCVVLREKTEWVRLVRAGKAFLAGRDPERVAPAVLAFVESPAWRAEVARRRVRLEFGATARILEVLERRLRGGGSGARG